MKRAVRNGALPVVVFFSACFAVLGAHHPVADAQSADRAVSPTVPADTAELTNRQTGCVAYTLPLVTPASNTALQGFVRIINHSDRAGQVSISAIDDSGGRFGPISLSLQARAAVHFNSQDLESGNASKGLSGVGNGSGNWRLELTTDLEIEPLAYIRTSDGFVTNMHEVAAEIPEGSNRYHVPFLNPGKNQRQVSRLRLINPDSGSASIDINGVDDLGRAPPLGTVSLTLGAGMARMLTASQLENGSLGISGRLGAGEGKWRLSVTADRPIQVMSLLQLPTGHLTNLSRGTGGSSAGTPPPPAPSMPDLVVQWPSVSDSSLNAGQSFTLRATVCNQGTARSAATTLRYFRSSDETISTGDTEVGMGAVSALPASGTSPESISLRAPSSAGTYYYGACVNTVSGESNTGNNCTSGVRVTVGPGGGFAPDDEAEFNAFAVGKRISLAPKPAGYDVDITSPGRFREGPRQGRFSYRPPPVIHIISARPSANHARATFTTPVATIELRYDNGNFSTLELSFSSTTRGAAHYRWWNGTNGISNWRFVNIPPSPDLVVQSPSVSNSSPNAGQSFTLHATVRNQGNARSAATTLRYYRSSDATISTSDTQVGTGAVSALAASGTSPKSISLTAPSSGTYYYGACVDTVPGESNTGNNCTSGIRVTVPGFAPVDEAEFKALVANKGFFIKAYTFGFIFDRDGRFRVGLDKGYYSYSNTGANSATIRLNYDSDRLRSWYLRLTFSSARGGTVKYEDPSGSGTSTWWVANYYPSSPRPGTAQTP